MDNKDTDAFRDDEITGELRRLAGMIDPVPDHVLAAAAAALGTRDLDGEMAVLIADSAARDGTSVSFEPVRGGASVQGSRLLSFAGSGVQVDLEVIEHGDRLDLFGQFAGASAEGCVLEHATAGPRSLEVDNLGRFLVSGARHGPVRARCRSVAGVWVMTAWVTI
jgi:hypothetical protein